MYAITGATAPGLNMLKLKKYLGHYVTSDFLFQVFLNIVFISDIFM